MSKTKKKAKLPATAFLPAEWHPQSAVQLAWPHSGTDWSYMLKEVEACYIQVAREIAKRQNLLILSPQPEVVKDYLKRAHVQLDRVRFFECDTNDTWSRDSSFITLLDGEEAHLLDFGFNGWGLKFAADLDNQINRKLAQSGLLEGTYHNQLGFILEGGSIESDGQGTLLTTSTCLLSPNRNDELSRAEVEDYLKATFNLKQVLWLDHGYLAGDDTDSHIDTLARFCSPDSIAYVKCDNPIDEHYEELKKMEQQLQTFRTLEGKPYRLIPLPMADTVIFDEERLPATYANFLILNDAVLYPTYQQPQHDEEARKALQAAFPERELVGIDCSPLIKQHGSLHCITMQYPQAVVKA